MSKLQEILVKAKEDLSPWENIPKSKWFGIARQCKELEVEEIKERIKNLEKELKDTEKWDGDTQDDIYQTIYFFKRLLHLQKITKIVWFSVLIIISFILIMFFRE